MNWNELVTLKFQFEVFWGQHFIRSCTILAAHCFRFHFTCFPSLFSLWLRSLYMPFRLHSWCKFNVFSSRKRIYLPKRLRATQQRAFLRLAEFWRRMQRVSPSLHFCGRNYSFQWGFPWFFRTMEYSDKNALFHIWRSTRTFNKSNPKIISDWIHQKCNNRVSTQSWISLMRSGRYVMCHLIWPLFVFPIGILAILAKKLRWFLSMMKLFGHNSFGTQLVYHDVAFMVQTATIP